MSEIDPDIERHEQLMHVILQTMVTCEPEIGSNGPANVVACVATAKVLGFMMAYSLLNDPDQYEARLALMFKVIREKSEEAASWMPARKPK